MSDLLIIKAYPLRINAEVDKSYLESQGIKSIIEADDAGGMRQFPFAYKFGAVLKVLEKDFKKAKKLLEK